MSVADEAKAAAEAQYPAEVIIDGENRTKLPRTAFAHGYQRGTQRGAILRTREIIELIQEDSPHLANLIDSVMAQRHPDEVEIVTAEIRASR